MRVKHMIENMREVDYVPLGEFVVNYETNSYPSFMQDSEPIEYAIRRAVVEFERGVPEMAKKLASQGGLMHRDGYRLEFNMGAFRRIQK